MVVLHLINFYKSFKIDHIKMLVVSRQRDESMMIGDDVEVIIVDVRGDKVRLGITAPTTIPVHRREIYDAIQREKMGKEEVEKRPFKEKSLTFLVDEANKLVAENPKIVKDSNYSGKDKELYKNYMDEISKKNVY